jgi:2-polyprenyl-3-methyl-5-hydroxy-6-metoxy-1,4-benzoquinol methylase
LNDEDLVRAYTASYYPSQNRNGSASFEGTPLFILNQLFAQVERRSGRLAGKRLLDYGCGIGTLCGVARSYGMPAYGIEADLNARAIAAGEGSICVFSDIEDLLSKDPAAKFDVVILWQVIEHLRQPWQDLRALRALMKNGAWLVLSTPNARCLKARLEGARWINYQNPTHFYYFTRRSLRRTIEKAGFGSIATENFNFRYPSHSALRRASQRAIVPLGLGGELLFTARVDSAS